MYTYTGEVVDREPQVNENEQGDEPVHDTGDVIITYITDYDETPKTLAATDYSMENDVLTFIAPTDVDYIDIAIARNISEYTPVYAGDKIDLDDFYSEQVGDTLHTVIEGSVGEMTIRIVYHKKDIQEENGLYYTTPSMPFDLSQLTEFSVHKVNGEAFTSQDVEQLYLFINNTDYPASAGGYVTWVNDTPNGQPLLYVNRLEIGEELIIHVDRNVTTTKPYVISYIGNK